MATNKLIQTNLSPILPPVPNIPMEQSYTPEQILEGLISGKNFGIPQLAGEQRQQTLNSILGNVGGQRTMPQTSDILTQLTQPNASRAGGMALLAFNKPIEQRQIEVQKAPISFTGPSDFEQKAYNAATAYASQAEQERQAKEISDMYSKIYGIDLPQSSIPEVAQMGGKALQYKQNAEANLQARQEALNANMQNAKQNYDLRVSMAKSQSEREAADRDFKREEFIYRRGQDQINNYLKQAGLSLQERGLDIRAQNQDTKQKQTATGKILPASQVSDLQATSQGIQQLKTLGDTAKTMPDSLFDPITGRIQVLNPYSTNAQSFQQLVAATKQVIGKGLEGGVLRKEDESKYEKIIPKIGDTRPVIKMKEKQLSDMLQNKYNSELEGYKKAGYNTGGFKKPLTREQAIQIARQRGLIK